MTARPDPDEGPACDRTPGEAAGRIAIDPEASKGRGSAKSRSEYIPKPGNVSTRKMPGRYGPAKPVDVPSPMRDDPVRPAVVRTVSPPRAYPLVTATTIRGDHAPTTALGRHEGANHAPIRDQALVAHPGGLFGAAPRGRVRRRCKKSDWGAPAATMAAATAVAITVAAAGTASQATTSCSVSARLRCPQSHLRPV